MATSVKLYNPTGREVKADPAQVDKLLRQGYTRAPRASKEVIAKVITEAKSKGKSVTLINPSKRLVQVDPSRVQALLTKGYDLPKEEAERAKELPETPESKEEAEKANLDELDDDALRAFAKEQGVSVTKRMDRATILKALHSSE